MGVDVPRPETRQTFRRKLWGPTPAVQRFGRLGAMAGVVSTEAVVGFVDLSGFTATSELLAAEGREGTEQLRDFINHLFGPAIEVIERAGGDVGWFAGDAMVVLFDLAVATPAGAVAALHQVAAQIEATPAVETLAGRVSMSAKVGTARGPIDIHRHDGTRVRRWVDGDPVDRSADAESRAVPGQVVLHQSLRDALDGGEASPVADGYDLLTVAPASEPATGTSPALAWLRQPDRLPPSVAESLDDDLRFLDQHRPTTSLFLALPGERHRPDHVARLDAIISRHGGEIFMLGSGDKGVTAFAGFGAPEARADRELRAVTAAVQLRDALPDARIGLASGLVYAGRVGSDDRWDYTTIGDRVNVSARLMQAAAPGEIVADVATTAPIATRIQVSDQRDLTLKGKSEPERVSIVSGLTERPDELVVAPDATPLVGRDAEIDELLDLVRPGASMVALVGPAGVGKTRLAEVVLARLRVDTVVSAVDQAERAQPWRLWSRGLPGVLRVTPATAAEILGGDDRWPLLAPLIGLRNVPDTGLTRHLAGEERHAATVQTLVDTIRSRVSEPVVWMVEDLHFAADTSLDLLASLAPHLSALPLTVLATTRPEPHVEPLLDVASTQRFDLDDLPATAIGALIADRWLHEFGSEVDPALVDALAERCGGSPLFAEQLVAWAAASGVAADASMLPTDLDVPSGIADLVLARLDALDPMSRRTVNLASVLGRTFERSELVGAFSEAGIETGLQSLVAAGVLVGTERPSFSHGLLHEVAYERLSYDVRRALHLDVLEYLESEHGDTAAVAERLAHHAEHSADSDRQRTYFRLAGDLARTDWALPTAVHWYELLVPLVAEGERAELSLELGRMLFTSGDWPASERHLIDAAKADDATMTARAQMARAELLINQGSADAGFDLLAETVERVEGAGDHWLLREGLELQARMAGLLGDLDRAQAVMGNYQRLRDGSPDQAVVWAEPLAGSARLLWLGGDLDAAAIAYEELLSAALAANDLHHAAQLESDLAGILYERGDVDACLERLARARERAEATGFGQQLALIAGNEAFLRFELGEHEASAELAERVVTHGLRTGDARVTALGLERLAMGLLDGELLAQAIVVADRAGDDAGVLESWLAMAELELRLDRPARAREILRAVDGRLLPTQRVAADRVLEHVEGGGGSAAPTTLDSDRFLHIRSQLADQAILVDWQADFRRLCDELGLAAHGPAT